MISTFNIEFCFMILSRSDEIKPLKHGCCSSGSIMMPIMLIVFYRPRCSAIQRPR